MVTRKIHKKEKRLKDLAGKIAFVTGAASGIGLGIATALAQAGVKVMLCDIEEAALASAVEGLERANADVASVRADVSLKVELQAAAEETRARYGNVHILINKCGRGWRRALRYVERHRLELDTWRQLYGRGLGHRDFCADDREPGRRTHRVHGLHRWPGLGQQ